MKVVMQMVVRDDADIVDAQLAFHLSIGVNYVLATDHESSDGTAEILEAYAREGVLRRIATSGAARDAEWRAAMARLAAHEHGAEWLLDADVDEFWLPRAEGFAEVLGAMPKRYGIVQGLVRTYLPQPQDGQEFYERMTMRDVLADLVSGQCEGRIDWALRPLHRVADGMTVVGSRTDILDGRVPLRAWYPFEVLRFPVRSREQAERKARGASGPVEARTRVERLVAERWAGRAVWEELVAECHSGPVVQDVRVRDLLRQLEREDALGAHARFARAAPSSLALQSPTVVDDVAYAGECAAVGEVDFEPLQARISALERRIGDLEGGWRQRLRRRLARFRA
jgi:hypothetical protein